MLIGKAPLVTEVKGIGVLILDKKGGGTNFVTETEAQAIRESRNMMNYVSSYTFLSAARSCPLLIPPVLN
jgi:hypothetical protein